MSTDTTNVLDITVAGVAEAATSTKMVKFDQIKVDLSRNPRDEAEDYTPKALETLARSIWAHKGLTDPPMVVERVGANGKPEYHLVKGHRRVMSIKQIREIGIPKSGTGDNALPAVDPAPDFLSTINVVVKKGLDPASELLLVMDHGTIKGLSQRGKFRSAKILLNAGLTQQQTADQIGCSRQQVSRFEWILRMPAVVEQHYTAKGKLPDGTEAIHLTDAMIVELNKAYREDQKLPDARIKVGGPNFTEEWEKVVKGAGVTAVKSLTTKELVALAEMQTDEDLRDLFCRIAGKDNVAPLHVIVERIKMRLRPIASVAEVIEEGVSHTISE